MDISEHMERKNRFGRFLGDRFFLRFHMFLILTATALAGLLATKILLMLHVKNMFIRYPFAVILSYLAFFGFVKLWLLYLSSSSGSRRVAKKITEDVADIPDIPLSLGTPSFETSAVVDPFSGGSGHFGGGGASGVFDSAGDMVGQTAAESVVSTPVESSGSGVAEAAGSAAGDAASDIFEDAGIVLVILGILLALVFGAGIYLIYEAPMILSEAAFEFLLASSLIRGMKKLDNPDWMGSIFRTTLVPFGFVLVIAVIAASVAYSVHPGATKMSEVLKHLLTN